MYENASMHEPASLRTNQKFKKKSEKGTWWEMVEPLASVSNFIHFDSIWDTILFFFGDRFQENLEVTNPLLRILFTWVSYF